MKTNNNILVVLDHLNYKYGHDFTYSEVNIDQIKNLDFTEFELKCRICGHIDFVYTNNTESSQEKYTDMNDLENTSYETSQDMLTCNEVIIKSIIE
jgi:hypothetical protein